MKCPTNAQPSFHTALAILAAHAVAPAHAAHKIIIWIPTTFPRANRLTTPPIQSGSIGPHNSEKHSCSLECRAFFSFPISGVLRDIPKHYTDRVAPAPGQADFTKQQKSFT